MPVQRQTFHHVVGAVIDQLRADRKGNLKQRKLPGLVTDWHRSRLLTLQAAYMLLTRAQLMPAAGSGPELLQALIDWTDTLTAERLFDVYAATGDTGLTACFLCHYVDYTDLGHEMARRLEPKRFTVEMIRAGWGEEKEPIADLTKRFNAKSFASDLRERSLKDPMNEWEDYDQENWLRAMELFERPIKRTAAPTPPLTWLPAVTMQPHEQAFFEGPIAAAWRGSLPQVREGHDRLKDAERIPYQVRYAQEANVEKIERRHRITGAQSPDPDRKEGHD